MTHCGRSMFDYGKPMRLANFVVGVFTALYWSHLLALGISGFDLIACVKLPQESIIQDLLFQVVFPTAMLVLTVGSVAATNYVPHPGKGITWIPFMTLALVLVYHALATDLSITGEGLRACRP